MNNISPSKSSEGSPNEQQAHSQSMEDINYIKLAPNRHMYQKIKWVYAIPFPSIMLSEWNILYIFFPAENQFPRNFKATFLHKICGKKAFTKN
jgi:hypothetical protein